MKTYAVVLALLVGADSFAPAFQSRRTFGVVTSRGENGNGTVRNPNPEVDITMLI